MRKFFITGGAGFIGSNFIHYIINNTTDIQIINLDSLTYAGNLENLSSLESNPRYKFIHGNINDSVIIDEIFKKEPIEKIIHFAAESHVDRSISDPLIFIQTNVLGTANLLVHSERYWKNLSPQQKKSFRFLHVSTDEVFGSLKKEEPAFTETTPYAPNSPYAASKASSDHLVRAYFHTYGFPIIITNCSNNYGQFQNPEKLIPLVISNALHGKLIPVYGDGKQIRDWLFVKDHCEALLSVLNSGIPGQSYNIGGNNQPTNLIIINTICSILDSLIPNSKYTPHANLIDFVKDRPGHDRRYAMDTTKISSQLGWFPKESLESGLRMTINWYLDNEAWVTNVLKKKSHKKWMENNYTKRGANTL
jgi:dTDP-glucose 4,6-dehydratase